MSDVQEAIQEHGILSSEPGAQVQAPAAEAQLRLPGFEGQSIDKIRVTFSGTVELDRDDFDNIAFFNALRFGKRADLQVSGMINNRSFKQTHDADGNSTTISVAAVSVDTVQVKD